MEKTLPSSNASNASNASHHPKTLQTPLPTFPISATTLIILGFLFINLFYKKIFSIFISPEQHDASHYHLTRHCFYFVNLDLGNFSNFRNYPNYFRFPIYKFILQKNIFYFYISRTTRRKI